MMRNDKALDPDRSTLTEFSTLVWRELWMYSPEGRRARWFAGFGVLLVGLSVISLVLFGIYRALGSVLLGPVGAVPGVVLMISAAGVFCGVVLLGVAALVRRRSIRVLTAADVESSANGHAISWDSHTL